MTSLSVLVPVFNEQYLVASSLERLHVLATSPHLSRIQVVVVDDCSRDSTPAILKDFRVKLGLPAATGAEPPPPPGTTLTGRGTVGRTEWVFLRHDANRGKGAAIRSALELADCEITVIHDADLEYHPSDLLRIVEVFGQEGADAVFGSRFAGGERRRVLMYRHELGNRLLTFLTNLVTNLNLSDMETCYKAVRTDLLKSIPIVSNDFRLEPELTIKLAKREARLFEVAISYSGRTYLEGKKINWRDGVLAIWSIFRFALSDKVYKADPFGSEILGRISRATRYNAWMAEVVRPHCGSRLLEIGSGTGNLTRHLVPRDHYVASDINPLYIRTLEALAAGRPYLFSRYTDLTDLASFPQDDRFDTVVCLNVIEHVDDDRGALENIRATLAPGGKAIVLVPYGQWNFGSLDEVLGHKRRYSEADLRRLSEAAGFRVEELLRFNHFSSLFWWFSGRVLRRRTFSLLQMKVLNLLVPILKRIDPWLPLPPLSLIAVLTVAETEGRPGVRTDAQTAG